MRCAFLTTDDLSGFVSDDDLALPPLRARGCEVEAVPWRAEVDWSAFDGVVIRTTWDYHRHPHAFLAALERITRSGTRLENPLPLVRWNLRKSYLRDLAARGVDVVPTAWLDRLEPDALADSAAGLGVAEVVVKPVVGASGDDTFRVAPAGLRDRPDVLRALHGRAVMVQPFLRSVRTEGEWAVMVIDGRVSHAVRKIAAPDEFRVQEEHGGSIEAVAPDAVLLEATRRAIGWMDTPPLYARADFLRDDGGVWRLGELELIEPSLYLRADPAAPDLLAEAIVRRLSLPHP